MRNTQYLAAFLAAGVCLCGAVEAYSGGSGTAGDPYRLATKADLLALAGTPGDYGKCFKLTADIDMGGQVFTEAIIASGDFFTGTFDGGGHKITNFVINGSTYLGLFGFVAYGGTVLDLGLESCSVSGSAGVGSLAGYNYDGSTISNCYSACTVTGTYYTGGLAGRNEGSIRNCHWTGASVGSPVGDPFYIGGLVGENTGTISGCYSTGEVVGICEVGGLAGYNSGNITNCYSTGAVTCGDTSTNVGGLVGENNNGSISDCNSTGAVNGAHCVGGLAGLSSAGSSISNCNATGTVTNGVNGISVGGLVGDTRGAVTNCYSTGAVTTGSPSMYTGGLAGSNSGTINSCYSISSVGGCQDVGGLAGSSSGTITNCHSTGAVSGGYDSDILGGLVGNNGGTISKSYSTGSVTGGGPSIDVGGLVGSNSGTITRSFSKGNAGAGSTSMYIGGLVGFNNWNGTISDCYSMGSAAGHQSVGGLAGYDQSGRISNCYSTGTVAGSQYLGGFMGYSDANSPSGCFWDTDTSGQAVAIGYGWPDTVEGKTTAEMKTLATFIAAGWDFSDSDGDAADWIMPQPGVDYAKLAWQPAASGDVGGAYGVNAGDFAVIAAAWQSTPGSLNWNQACDLYADGKVDFMDIMVFSADWLKGY